MDKPTKDPRTGIWLLRKRVPARYLSVAGQRSGFVKISTRTKDDREARRVWPDVMARYKDMEAEWERKLSAVALTPDRAAVIVAGWAAWIAAGHPLDTGGEDSDVFEPLDLPVTRTTDRVARMWDRVEAHAAEALKLADVTITEETRPVLLQALLRPVQAAYLQADLGALGVSGTASAVNPLQATLDALPPVPRPLGPQSAALSLDAILSAWKAVAAVKPRTIAETEYALSMLGAFLGHSDTTKITKDDLRRWRDAAKAGGTTNATWNNRLSLIRQVFARAVSDGRLAANPADNTLRLEKAKGAVRLPYSDDETARILLAARSETAPSLRWVHWVMAFTGMRAGEVLQLTAGDVRQEGAVWFLAVHEDDEGKTVKTGQRRNVPLHPALIDEGFLAYAQTVTGDDPLFPDKKLDRHGNRGGRAWNHVGKWVRTTVGIADPKKAPNHSHRHRVEDELRAVEVPEDARDAIVGHARKTTGRSYGIRGEALARLYRELAKLPVPPGITPGSP
jgi:integrase